jgi:hypothetical protein
LARHVTNGSYKLAGKFMEEPISNSRQTKKKKSKTIKTKKKKKKKINKKKKKGRKNI